MSYTLHFEGSLEEVDTILCLVQDGINQCNEELLECIAGNETPKTMWWKGRKQYLSDLQKRIVFAEKET